MAEKFSLFLSVWLFVGIIKDSFISYIFFPTSFTTSKVQISIYLGNWISGACSFPNKSSKNF